MTLSNEDPLFQQKRAILTALGLSTQQAFDLTRAVPLPPLLVPYMRLAYADAADALPRIRFEDGAPPVDEGLDQLVACQLASYLDAQARARDRGGGRGGERGELANTPQKHKLSAPPKNPPTLQNSSPNPRKRRAQVARYKHPLWRDLEIINDPASSPRQRVAARLTKARRPPASPLQTRTPRRRPPPLLHGPQPAELLPPTTTTHHPPIPKQIEKTILAASAERLRARLGQPCKQAAGEALNSRQFRVKIT